MLELCPRPNLNFWAVCGRTGVINSGTRKKLWEIRPGNSLAQLNRVVFVNHCCESGWHDWANIFLPVKVACKSNGL